MKLSQTNTVLFACCISTLALAPACGFFASSKPATAASSDPEKPADTAASAGTDAGAKPMDLATYKLPLTIDVPASASVEKVGDTDVNISVGDNAVRVGPAYEELDTVPKAKAYYSKGTPVEYVKEDANLLVWKIGGGQQGFVVLARAQGKTYSCEGSGSSKEIEISITRCKSLKAATAQGETKDAGNAAKKAEVKMGEAKPVSLTTHKLPLSIDLPPEAEINPLGKRVTIFVGQSTLDLGPAESWETTIAQAKATQDQSFANEYVKQEADLLVWKRDEKESGFLVLAKQGGKTYSCKGTALNADVAGEVTRCRSLKPAK